MKRSCPHAQKFRQLVNMSPAAIRAWSKDPRSKCASFQSTRDRLPALAELKSKPPSSWSEADCRYAGRVVNFVSRHRGQMGRFGCTERETVALLNWGHKPRCPMPRAGCSTRPPAGPKPRRGAGDR